jgi:hypothetical protein
MSYEEEDTCMSYACGEGESARARERERERKHERISKIVRLHVMY